MIIAGSSSTLSHIPDMLELGNYRYIVRIWDLMRSRDEHLLSVIAANGSSAPAGWTGRSSPMTRTPEAIAQAEFLSRLHVRISFQRPRRTPGGSSACKEAPRHLRAIANSYAACEIQWLPRCGARRQHPQRT